MLSSWGTIDHCPRVINAACETKCPFTELYVKYHGIGRCWLLPFRVFLCDALPKLTSALSPVAFSFGFLAAIWSCLKWFCVKTSSHHHALSFSLVGGNRKLRWKMFIKMLSTSRPLGQTQNGFWKPPFRALESVETTSRQHRYQKLPQLATLLEA